MFFRVVLSLLAAFLVIFQESFLALMPMPFGGLEISLIVLTALIVNFRRPEAYLVAAVTGFVLDVLSVTVFGTYLIMMVLLGWIVAALFERVFTHVSFYAFLGINTAAFIVLRTMRLLHQAGMAYLADRTMVGLISLNGLSDFFRTLIIQLVLAAVLAVIGKWVGQMVSTRFFIRQSHEF